jgi:EAL domain-containing protein (putative c-di-GMP-specific phosphodiesterase class I)
MDDPVRALETLKKLHATGVDLSIDDFGTGYSSLAYLKRLPVDELKIDKSFVMKMESDIGDAKIVRSTIDLAHNLGLRVVAEGIETEIVWHLLAKMGCDQGQGYFMSRPIPVDQLENWIKHWVAPKNPQSIIQSVDS